MSLREEISSGGVHGRAFDGGPADVDAESFHVGMPKKGHVAALGNAEPR
jgi:hypothetical protein